MKTLLVTVTVAALLAACGENAGAPQGTPAAAVAKKRAEAASAAQASLAAATAEAGRANAARAAGVKK